MILKESYFRSTNDSKDFCNQHSFGTPCPPGSERRYIIRNSAPTMLREGQDSEFEVHCKEVVEYCVSKKNLQQLSMGELTMEELVKRADVQREKIRLPFVEEIAKRNSVREDDGNDWSAGYYTVSLVSFSSRENTPMTGTQLIPVSCTSPPQ